MHEFWYHYVKPKYWEKDNLCYMNTNNCIVYIKTEDIYSDIAKDTETRHDTSNYELNISLPKRKIKKVIGVIKYELAQSVSTWK